MFCLERGHCDDLFTKPMILKSKINLKKILILIRGFRCIDMDRRYTQSDHIFIKNEKDAQNDTQCEDGKNEI